MKIQLTIIVHPARMLLGVLILLLSACSGGGGGGGGESTPDAIVFLELLDPTPGAGDNFGTNAVFLANGNIVVTDPGDDTMATNAGAVHLYSPTSDTPIASIYGDVSGDRLGSEGVTALGNNNYVIASALDDEGGIVNAGSVRLVDGASGMQVGTPLVGDVSGDRLGIFDLVTALDNNNYVIASEIDNEGGVSGAGSVRLVDGTTGTQLEAIIGTRASDIFAAFVIEAPGGGRAAIVLPNFANNGQVNSGRVLVF